MLIDEVKAALANYAVYDAGDWQEVVLKVLPKLIAAEEMAEAIADNAWRTDTEKAALAAYRKAGETNVD
jgi:hypothetical protein